MARVEKVGEVWYVRYKDVSGRWKRKSCGRGVKRMEAEYIAKQYSVRELNNRFKMPVRLVNIELPESLEKFKNEVLPRSPLGIDKQESSIRRERSAIDNITLLSG